MADFRFLVRLQMDSGIPENAVVNVWHAETLLVPDGHEDFMADLEAFYQAIRTQLSEDLALGGHTITAYDLADPMPRAPVATLGFSFSATGSQASVPELAICVSFQGVRTSGSSQARRRGRVYIGPLGNCVTSTTDPSVAPGTITAFQTAAAGLLSASKTSATYDWCVYSRTDDAMVPVDNGWIDNAFDIQRRRGLTATTRSTFGLAG